MNRIQEQYEETLRENCELTKQSERLIAKLEKARLVLEKMEDAPWVVQDTRVHKEVVEALKAIRE